MSKFFLLSEGAIKTNYDTTVLTLDKRVSKTKSTANQGIVLAQGTNHLIVDNDVEVKEEELKDFINQYFFDSDKAFNRINSIVNPISSFKTIF